MSEQISTIKGLIENRKADVMGHDEYSKSAVMLPLVMIENKTYILFEVRSKNLSKQPGEVCFPGGKIDKSDVSEEQAAVRELCEELGLTKEDVQTIAPLDYLVTPFRGIIYPFVGELKRIDTIQPNPTEVETVFYVPLDYFLENEPDCFHMEHHIRPQEDFPFHLIKNRSTYKERTGLMPQYFYQYKDHVIWGLTARIVYHFVDLIKNPTTS
ncbi:NUDIX hydrolase [Bacillus sp. FJAT-45350]|uniref:NUDIX hydrolase n=1 Tax=Bacillus sp. FJAT-45350 TaxID=2011014 RepID=UPI00211C1ACE|nr:CoA pyrophosphatase [Bacillus sp. FJAT-45350]